MQEFFLQACILAWTIIGTVVGWVIIAALVLLIVHELFVGIVNRTITKNNPDNEEIS
jgi:hypothetical protein